MRHSIVIAMHLPYASMRDQALESGGKTMNMLKQSYRTLCILIILLARSADAYAMLPLLLGTNDPSTQQSHISNLMKFYVGLGCVGVAAPMTIITNPCQVSADICMEYQVGAASIMTGSAYLVSGGLIGYYWKKITRPKKVFAREAIGADLEQGTILPYELVGVITSNIPVKEKLKLPLSFSSKMKIVGILFMGGGLPLTCSAVSWNYAQHVCAQYDCHKANSPEAIQANWQELRAMTVCLTGVALSGAGACMWSVGKLMERFSRYSSRT